MPTTNAQHMRSPVVAVVGHIDHGKSTLLDYIRKTNVVEGEAGGITQHLSAYEATHKNAAGEHRITFLDTPGHEAFAGMRARGLEAADVAILVVSSEDGVKPQTLEAYKLIQSVGIPFVVALTKIDKPGANIEKAKSSLLENQIYLEGYGGDISWVGVSSKSGEGVPELLDLLLLAAELKGLSANFKKPAEGLIIEAHVDQRRGNTATLIVRDGSIESGQFVVAGGAWAPVRIMENFLGKPTKEAFAGSPVRIVGFSSLPGVGEKFSIVENKKEAEQKARGAASAKSSIKAGAQASVAEPSEARSTQRGFAEAPKEGVEQPETVVLPIVIKTDFAGTGEAVMHELAKLPPYPRLELRVVSRGVGAISEGDIKLVGGGRTPGIVIGFNVKVESGARELAERAGVEIQTFEIIYKLAEWLQGAIAERRPRAEVRVLVGAAKVLKFFSKQSGRAVLGARVEEGAIKYNQELKIMRREEVIGRGTVVGLQQNKKEVKVVERGAEFGVMLKTSTEVAAGDRLEASVTQYQ